MKYLVALASIALVTGQQQLHAVGGSTSLVTQVISQYGRGLRRAKKRPCAKSIQKHCAAAKNAAAKQACLRARLGTNALEPRCETIVAARSDALHACRPVAAAVGCAQGPVPIACMQRRYRKGSTPLAGTACAAALDRLSGHKAATRAPTRVATERAARIASILKAMPPAEAGGIRGENARLVAAAHIAEQETHATSDYLAKGYPPNGLPDGTHVKATRIGHGSGGPRSSPRQHPFEQAWGSASPSRPRRQYPGGAGASAPRQGPPQYGRPSPWEDSRFSSPPWPRASSTPWEPSDVRSWSDPAYRKHRRHHKNALQMVGA
jgi:hypothetical protein